MKKLFQKMFVNGCLLLLLELLEIYACIHTHAHMHTCTHAHMHTCMHAHMHTTHKHTDDIHTTYTQTKTQQCTYTHTQQITQAYTTCTDINAQPYIQQNTHMEIEIFISFDKASASTCLLDNGQNHCLNIIYVFLFIYF